MREICTSGSTRGEEPQGYPVAPSPTLPVRCWYPTLSTEPRPWERRGIGPRKPRSGVFR